MFNRNTQHIIFTHFVKYKSLEFSRKRYRLATVVKNLCARITDYVGTYALAKYNAAGDSEKEY